MFKLNFKIAWRNLIHNKTYTIFNMLGLSIGLAGFILILLYINQETRFDKWDPELKNTYMIAADYTKSEAQYKGTKIKALFAKTTRENIHDVENVSISNLSGRKLTHIYVNNGKEIKQNFNAVMVDSLFLDIYPLKASEGNLKAIFDTPNSIAISKKMAKFFFGNESPINKVIIQDRGVNFPAQELIIKGVWDHEQQASYFDFEVLMVTNLKEYGDQLLSNTFSTLIKLRKGADPNKVYDQLNANYIKELAKFSSENSDVSHQPTLAQAKNILLENEGISSIKIIMEPVSNLNLGTFFSTTAKQTIIYILISLAAFLVLISCINYTNLTLVLAQARAKEVGIKKVLGAFRWSLLKQFFLETAIQCIVALVVALILAELLLPQINQLSDQSLVLLGAVNWKLMLLQVVGILLLIMMLSGVYPALILAGFKPAKVLKGNFNTEKSVGGLRRFLIIFQFTTAIALVISFLVIYAQLQFMRQKDLGLQPEQLMSLNISDFNHRNLNPDQFSTIKRRLLNIKGVESVTRATEQAINDSGFAEDFTFERTQLNVESHFVDPNYFEVIKGKILTGRSFSERMLATDSVSSIVVNETAYKMFGLTSINQAISTKNDSEVLKYNVIGVVKDIQSYGFEQKIAPTVYLASDFKFRWRKVIILRLNTANISQTVDEIKSLWREIEPGSEPSYNFADETFALMNKSYETSMKVITAFGFLTLLVSIFGLIGLAAYSAKLRVKEIALRRILGASIQQLLQLLNRDFVKLVLIANLFADILAYIYMKKWFASFVYHIEMPFVIFIITNFTIIILTILIVSFQSIKAVKANPIDALKYE